MHHRGVDAEGSVRKLFVVHKVAVRLVKGVLQPNLDGPLRAYPHTPHPMGIRDP